MQYLGMSEMDLSKISASDLMLYALANISGNGDVEGGYAARWGSNPVNTFPKPKNGATLDPEIPNPITAAYPSLFPYGIGGLEAEREVSVPFETHVKWALQYHDKRFRTHHSFVFYTFSIIQRRQALRSARVQMNRRDFLRDAQQLSTLTLQDLKQAEEEEAQHKPITNRTVKTLRKHLQTMGGKVMGSDNARSSYRPMIWGTTTMMGMPSLWITINPHDIDDPIAQVFCGEDIDLDKFVKTLGPDSTARAKNIAKDPYAAAKFFRCIILAVLTTLFGIDASGQTVKSSVGIFGRMAAYFGVVEAQGRGTLHLHMICWLCNAPTMEEMKFLLCTANFREKLKMFIKANIRSHIEGTTDASSVKAIPRVPSLAYSRPIDPDTDTYNQDRIEFERGFARTQQIHTCTKPGDPGCMKKDGRTGQYRCKRRAPFPLSPEDVVHEDGQWKSKRLYGYLNSWNPSIAESVRANHDLKLLTNGEETKDTAWYMTTYATKKQGASYNSSAVLATAVAYHQENNTYIGNILESSRLMLFRCLNMLGRQMELSGPQAVSYLMGWGDTFRSHEYIPIYWGSMISALNQIYPGIGTKSDDAR
jgi:hypothetical protein